MSMIRPEPWKIMSRNKGVDNQRPQGAKSGNMGGGDNPARASKNRNPSGDHKTPGYGDRDRARRSGDSSIGGMVPDIAGHPAANGRNAGNKVGDKSPRIIRKKPNNKFGS